MGRVRYSHFYRVLAICFLLVQSTILLSSEDEEPWKSEIDLLINKLPVYFNTNTDSIFIAAESIQRLSDLNNYEKGKVYALLAKGIYYHQTDNQSLANEYLESSLKLAEKTDNAKLVAQVCYSKGYTHYNNTEYYKAYTNYSRALDIYEEIGPESRSAHVLNNLGSIFFEIDKIDIALDYYSRAMRIFQKSNHPFGIKSTINVGCMHTELQQYDSAKFYFDLASDAIKPEDIRSIALLHTSKVELFIETKEYNLAEENCLIALEAAKQLRESRMIGYLYFVLGKTYNQKNIPAKSIEYLDIAYAELIKGKNFSYLELTTKELELAYNKSNQLEKALYYSNLHKNYSDSVRSTENTIELAKKMAAREYEEKIQADKDKYKVKLTLIIGVSFILTVIILIIIIRYSKQRKIVLHSIKTKEKLENDLKKNDVDLLTKTMHLIEKEELIEGLEEKLKQLGRDMKPSKARGIQELISEIRVSKSENIWQEFESRFNSVNDDFSERLIKKFPDLTPKELRLCSLLRLNLSTKEISILTHQNPLSINKARFRLRKKLELNNTETNLTSYLMEF